ncbi:hypothetical protein [Pseudofrankia asymbiotica]|uniref:Uncharacterized protein n=1 Tax=Pseudofrankia asymbiotica TaxID=1834516 RepID=A0A1V2IEQ8_9ACTN|nr:hypothetical protein [Pseudofrankia asymbiotica]ONH31607.1 hypothetical protein BL253_07950 [Pseudofrankia asymbiotica]
MIPQFVGRLPFIEQLDELARETGAEFHEITLLDSKENVLRRFQERSSRAADPAHVEAQILLDRSGGMVELSQRYDRVARVDGMVRRHVLDFVAVRAPRVHGSYAALGRTARPWG